MKIAKKYKNPKILLVGHNKWACLVLRALIDNNYKVVGVVTETDEFDEGEKENYERFAEFAAYESLKEVASALGLPIFQPKSVNSPEFMAQIDQIDAELIVIVSYHEIIKQPLLDRFHNRMINLHAGALPHYRGRAPINWAIINGEDHIGVTAHYMDEGIDTGPIIVQNMVKIKENDRAIDVLLRALPLFPEIALKAIRLIEKGEVRAKPQNPSEGSYFPRRTPEDGVIDWKFETAKDIHNKVRALAYPYPGAFTFYRGEKLIIERTSMPDKYTRISPLPGLVFGRTSMGGVKVTTSDAFIIVEEVRISQKVYKAAEQIKIGSKLA